MTLVRPPCPWTSPESEIRGRIAGFVEKFRLENWVNGGFLVMEPRALEAVGLDDVLE